MKKETIRDILIMSLAFILGVFVFTFALQLAVVNGKSMNDTYNNGDVLLCTRLVAPKVGDVVVFDVPNYSEPILIKRVIAEGGDTVYIDFDTGEVKVNDITLCEEYIKEPTHLNTGDYEYPVTVPEGCYFVMGDNRNHSTDSRDSRVGFVSEEQIRGKVLINLG